MFYKASISIFLLFLSVSMTYGQHAKKYNLVKLLGENKLDTSAARHTKELRGAQKKAISATGIVWLRDLTFKEGAIDVDLRGKNVFLKSFLGIAFHAKDTATYELVYFRPFRFQSADIPTRKWSVQYMSMPGNDYAKLRKESPGVYENEVNPVPGAEDWFHATIVVKEGWITVYVNHSATPSLKVKKLDTLTEGKIGLWSDDPTLSSDFAGLTITE